MAEESEMRRSVFLIAGALTKFAKSQDWGDFDYWIFYKTNPDWDKVHFVFVAEGFNDQDPYESTRKVWSYLEKELVAQPDVLKSLGLVVRSKKKVDEGGLYAIGPGYTEFWTMYPARKS
jgi:hypothetical protein